MYVEENKYYIFIVAKSKTLKSKIALQVTREITWCNYIKFVPRSRGVAFPNY